MPQTITAMPDNPGTAGTLTVPDGHGWLDTLWSWATEWINTVPGWSWAAAIGTLTVATLVLIPVLQNQSYKAGQRAAGKKSPTRDDIKDRRLLIGALIPTISFWIAVLIGSGRGLIAFGRDDLNWHGGWEYLVPATLDGVAISFGLLAFRAIRKNRSPDRAVRIAGSAMVASSGINFLHEVSGSSLGAAYLAILSLLGMLIFDELLAQFQEGAAYIQRLNPKFGLRWLTWPTNTLCAWIAWRNYPVDTTTDASIKAAVRHLDAVRRSKAINRARTVNAPAWWMDVAPWARIKQLGTALEEERSATLAEHARATELADRITDLEKARSADLAAAEHRLEKIQKQAAEHVQRITEQVQRSAAEQIRTERAEHAAETADLRAELAGTVVRIGRSGGVPKTSSGRKTSGNAPERKTGAAAPITDREALELMFAEHPEPSYVWTDRETNRITGAGFSSRAPRLTRLAAEHLAECPEQSHKACDFEPGAEQTA